MKKILGICTGLLCMASIAANAQVTTSAGLKLQANYSKYRLSGMPGVDSKYGVGAGAGGFLKVGFGEHFAIQPELLFNFNRSKLKSDQSGKLRYMGLELPVYAVGQINAGSGKIFLGAGPYLAYGLSNKLKDGTSVSLYKKQEGQSKAAMSRLDYGVGAILGYEFGSGLLVNAGYKLGLKDQLKASGSSMKVSAFSLGVGYKF